MSGISTNILSVLTWVQTVNKVSIWMEESIHARIQKFSSGGVQVSLTKKALPTFFFFLVLSLFYRNQIVNFKEIYQFLRFQRGYNIFQGGSNFFQWGGGGSNCIFPIETHITCDFPGRVWTPCPPLWIRTCHQYTND